MKKKADQSLFKGIEQSTIILGGHHCTSPLFYMAGTASIGMFPASLSKLRHKITDPRLNPATIFPRVGNVAVIAFEFETTIEAILHEPDQMSHLLARHLQGASPEFNPNNKME